MTATGFAFACLACALLFVNIAVLLYLRMVKLSGGADPVSDDQAAARHAPFASVYTAAATEAPSDGTPHAVAGPVAASTSSTPPVTAPAAAPAAAPKDAYGTFN